MATGHKKRKGRNARDEASKEPKPKKPRQTQKADALVAKPARKGKQQQQQQDPPAVVEAGSKEAKAKAAKLKKAQEGLRALEEEGLLQLDCCPPAAVADPASFWRAFSKQMLGLIYVHLYGTR